MSKQTIIDAINYKREVLGDGNAKKNVLYALQWMASIHGWTSQEEALEKLPIHAREKFFSWPDSEKPTGVILMDASNDAEVLARWTHWLAAKEIAHKTRQ